MLVDQLKKSLSLSFLDKYVGYVLRFVATIIIARLCTPHEIGIFSVAFVLISIGHVLRDFGVAQYLIQAREISIDKIRASLSLMWMIAWSLCGLLWITKAWIAQFYGEPELEHAIEVLSLIYLLAPFGSVRIALLRREMDFSKLAIINIGSYVSLHCVTIFMALKGFGYEALVWGQVAGVLATLLGTLYYSPANCLQWPGFKGMRDVFKFGLPLCSANIIETIADGGADLILGRTMSMTAVGLFGKAQGLMNLFKVAVTSAVWPVVLPYFSIKNRQDEDLLPDYLKGIELYCMFAWPFFVGLFFFAESFVLVLFGDQWIEIIPLVRVLCFAAMTQAMFPFYNAVLVARGEVSLNFKLQSVIAVARLLAVCVGAFYGLMQVAICLLLAEMFGFLLLYVAISRLFKLKLSRFAYTLKHPFTLVILLSCLFAGLDYLVHTWDMSYMLTLSVAIATGLLAWLISLKLMNHMLFRVITAPLQKLGGNHVSP